MIDRRRPPLTFWRFCRDMFAGKHTSDTELLLPVTELLTPQNPPPGLLGRVEEEIDTLDPGQPGPQADRLGTSGFHTRNKAFLSGLMSGAVAAALLLIVWPQTVFQDNLTPIAAMAGPAGAVVMTADTKGPRHYLIVEFQPMKPDPDGAVELWAIAPKDATPRSLGLLAEKGDVTILALSDPLESGAVLALSREPKGGSPRSGPTGPVLMTTEIR